MSTDVHTLTGAYVLDAVSEVERSAFEHHLTDCPSCAQEVRELRETTVRLGSATVVAPPPRLWDHVNTTIKVTRQRPPSRRRWRLAIGIAAASVVAAVALNVQSGDLEHRLAASQDEFGQITAILAAPDVKLTRQSGADGRAATMVISRGANGMVLLTQDLPALPPDQSVQAWFVTRDGRKTSAGQLDAPSGTLLVPDLAAAANASSLALTVEPRGGSSTPSDRIVLVVPMIPTA